MSTTSRERHLSSTPPSACDEALRMVRAMLPDDLNIDETEISNSEELMSRYAVRIPLVRLRNQTAELGWPFDACMLRTSPDSYQKIRE